MKIFLFTISLLVFVFGGSSYADQGTPDSLYGNLMRKFFFMEKPTYSAKRALEMERFFPGSTWYIIREKRMVTDEEIEVAPDASIGKENPKYNYYVIVENTGEGLYIVKNIEKALLVELYRRGRIKPLSYDESGIVRDYNFVLTDMSGVDYERLLIHTLFQTSELGSFLSGYQKKHKRVVEVTTDMLFEITKLFFQGSTHELIVKEGNTCVFTKSCSPKPDAANSKAEQTDHDQGFDYKAPVIINNERRLRYEFYTTNGVDRLYKWTFKGAIASDRYHVTFEDVHIYRFAGRPKYASSYRGTTKTDVLQLAKEIKISTSSPMPVMNR